MRKLVVAALAGVVVVLFIRVMGDVHGEMERRAHCIWDSLDADASEYGAGLR